MNYYPHHIGDYSKDTAHLTILEDGAYRRMLDLYYSSERPLPLNKDGLYRLVRARSKEEKKAVDTILEEFFIKGETGWTQGRVEEELEKARAEGEANKERRESEKERQRRHRDRRRNLFAGLREHGMTPPWDATTEELQEALTRVMSQDGNAPVTPPVTRDATATPLANNQEPIANNQEPKKKDDVGLTPNPRQQAREVLDFLNEKTGRSYEPVDANLKLIVARLKDGATALDLRQVVAKKCREWIGDPKMAEYLRPKTLFNATNFAQYKGELVNVE